MGEAFDHTGYLLGTAQAATKREVFDKLISEHPSAAEIRIHDLPRNETLSTPQESSPTSQERLWPYFAYKHLPGPLQTASQRFADLAQWLILTQRSSPERTVCLRKLLEAKDCAVRNALDTQSVMAER